MSIQTVRNSRAKYLSRAKVGSKYANTKATGSVRRKEFEATHDGYFVWRCSKKDET